MSGPQPALREHIPGLDGLRAIACLGIVVAHAGGSVGYNMGVLAMGVPLFFVLSGFLITGILVQAKGSPGYFRTFYAKRALRIWPVYYAALVVVLVLLRPVLIDDPKYAELSRVQGWYWLHASNWLCAIHRKPQFYALLHTWSLAVEEQFYLLWPLIVWACSRRALIAVSAALVVAGPAFRWWAMSRGWMVAAEWATPACVDLLAIGALVKLLPHPRIRTITAVIAGVCVAYLLLRPDGIWTPALWATALIPTAFGGIFAWWVLVATASPRPLTWAPLRWFGRRSYGIYVYHFPIMFWLLSVWRPFDVAALDLPVFLLISGSATCVLAELSWRCMEAPAMRLRRFFPSRRERIAVPTPVAA